MFKRFALSIILLGVIGLMLCAVCGLTAYFNRLPQRLSQHETIVLGQNRLSPGSQAVFRVLTRDSRDASPLPGAQIEVSLRPADGGPARTMYKGQTDEQGMAVVAFQLPEEAGSNQVLTIRTRSRLGADEIERPLTLERDYRVLLTTDKPIYQPGQVIHVRALALSAFDLVPAAGQDLEIVIADGKGNKVFRKKLATTQFGVAATDFQLANEVNTGLYNISAALGNSRSEKTINVEHYVLPKFAVELTCDRAFYLPGERVSGLLKASYFFGKPVANGDVLIQGYTFDVQRNEVLRLQGQTDAEGNFPFEFDLPPYLTGSELEGGMGRFYLQATVADQTRHAETSNLSLPVAQQSLVIEAIPEGGQFRPFVDNILYILTSYPDGTPAPTTITLDFPYENQQSIQTITGPYGLAEVHLKPLNIDQFIRIEARDAHGNHASREFYFQGEWSEETVLLRPEQPVYRVGDTMRLSILTSQPQGSVYLDIVREGQTVSTRSVDVRDGHAEVAIDLTPDLYGTLELHAYKILRSGNIARDTRLVVVDNAEGLHISIASGAASYRPGELAALNLQVNDNAGNGVQSAIGLAVVDESVFALAEHDPGFARLYFLLEQELLVPKYDLHGFSIPHLIQGVPEETAPAQAAIQGAAQASLAAAAPHGSLFTLSANSHQEAMQRAHDLQKRFYRELSRALFGLFMILPVGILALSAFAAWREKNIGKSILISLCMMGFCSMALVLLTQSSHGTFQPTWQERLAAWMEWNSKIMAAGFVLIALLAFAGLLGYAIRRRDLTLAWSLILTALTLAVLGMLLYVAAQGNLYPKESALLWGVTAFLLLPLSFLLRFSNEAIGKRIFPAAASLVLCVSFSIGALPALALTRMSAAMAPVRLVAQGEVEQAVNFGALPALAPAPTEMPSAVETKETDEAKRQSSANEPPRLRQYFPETMLWLPDAVTDETGSLNLEIPTADSITTWRVTALASSQDGRLGSAVGGLRVFQDFFIDLDLPQSLTVGDEVSIPVGVFNYLPEAQDVRLELALNPWFELLDEPVKEIAIAANEISVVYFRIRAVDFGRQPFKVTAWGARMSDAIQKEVQVFPDGKQITFSQADRLHAETPVTVPVNIPGEAIAGTQSLVVKIYPGVVSQVVEGLDSILRMPFGCFEQTSSTTYPNVLVLDYLKSSNQTSPEVQLKAEEYINLGYQRLTTFEVENSGGFSLFGDPPADRMLTAYGLQEFSDMSRVAEVDPALIQRAAEWLLAQQARDGSWENDRGLVHENTWSSLGDDRLPVTAYIAWSLIAAGYGDREGTQKGIDYVRENQAKADDAYVIALAANALVTADQAAGDALDGSTTALLERLAGMARREGNAAFWQSGVATFMGSEGKTGSIETTALAALAFLRSGSHPELANAALTYLIQQKDNFGTWYSTQATVLTLKALIESLRAGAEQVNATVSISLNDSQSRKVAVTSENFDVVQLISFEDLNPGRENLVEIHFSGDGNLMYQVSGSYYLPWDRLAAYPELMDGQELVDIQVSYDRNELSVNDTAGVNVTVSLRQGQAESALIDLGVPPGFAVLSEDLAALVTRFDDMPADYAFPTIERYELTGRQILVYVSNLSAGNPLSFSYRLRAKYPLTAQTPASNAYDYYNPDISGESQPQLLVVRP